MLAGINPLQYNAQYALPIHQYNNQNHHLGWEDATYARAIGGYAQHSVDPNDFSRVLKGERTMWWVVYLCRELLSTLHLLRLRIS